MSRGVAVPFGLRRQGDRLVPHPVEAAVLRDIAAEFVRLGGRMKATATAANTKGLRTRGGAQWSDSAVKRALRVVAHEGIVPGDLRDRCLALLRDRKEGSGAPARKSAHPLGGAVHCAACAGRMYLEPSGADRKFICRGCRSKIPVATLERVFAVSLTSVEIEAGEIVEALSDNARVGELTRRLGSQAVKVSSVWAGLDEAERRLLVESAVERVVVALNEVTVVFALEADSSPESSHFSSELLPSPACLDEVREKATAGDRHSIDGDHPAGDGHPKGLGSVREVVDCGRRSEAVPTLTVAPEGTTGMVRPTGAPGPVTSKENLPLLMTVEQAADILHTTPKAVYALVERGILPGVTRVGRRLLIRRDDLLDSLRSRAPSPKEVRR